MKNYVKILFLLLVSSCTAFPVVAQQKNTKPNISRLVMSMERLWRADQYLEAMDTAAYVLSLQPSNRTATDFIYYHWEKMDEDTHRRLQSLSDENDLSQAMERCEIYRLLDEIYTHLSDVPLPLHGTNDRWVWQPEVSYFTGHYDSERSRVVNLLLVKADAALLSHDVDTAREYYLLLLQKYLVTDGERSSNLQLLLQSCNERLRLYCSSSRLSDALFAWDLLNLSLTLEPRQEDIISLRPQLQQHIASLYLAQAQQSLLQGDTVQAHEFELYAEDWKLQ